MQSCEVVKGYGICCFAESSTRSINFYSTTLMIPRDSAIGNAQQIGQAKRVCLKKRYNKIIMCNVLATRSDADNEFQSLGQHTKK